MPIGHPLHESLLLIWAERDGKWWNAGSAVLIADRLALTAKHTFNNLWATFNPREAERERALRAFPAEVHDGSRITVEMNASVDVFQSLATGELKRWMIARAWSTGDNSGGPNDSDLQLILLEPHPESEAAKNYKLETPLTLQLFPPAIGQDVILFGWPDHPELQNGVREKPEIDIDSEQFYESHGIVTKLCTTKATLELVSFPHFCSDCENRNGMSGGPIFTRKHGSSYVLCGVHSRGGVVSGQESRESVLWQLLPLWIHYQGRDCRVYDLALEGVINAPCARYFTLTQDGNFTDISCKLPELQRQGTLNGNPDWLIANTGEIFLHKPDVGET